MGGKPIDADATWLWEHRACTISEMARRADCSTVGMASLLKRTQAERWRDGNGHLAVPVDWLQEQARRGRTLHEVADELHVKYRTLRDYCTEVGVRLRTVHMAPGFMHCPCQHEAECKQRLIEYRAVRCEPGEVAA